MPIPENPGALTVALQKGLVRDGTLRDWLAQVPDDRGGKCWPVSSIAAYPWGLSGGFHVPAGVLQLLDQYRVPSL